MSNKITITSIRCPDCGGSVEPATGESICRCPYCNAVLHIEEKERSRSRTTSNPSTPVSVGAEQSEDSQKWSAFTRFDAVVLVLTAIGMIWTAVATGNELFMIIVAILGGSISTIHMYIRGQKYRKDKWGF